jgi:UDP-N-acetylmuramoyl-tripeptide--D-alanyl-D-alanine ligase
MLELGADTEDYHYQVGRQLAEYDFASAVFVGSRARRILAGASEAGADSDSMTAYDDADQAAKGLVRVLRPGDRVFLKASRGIRLERVMEPFVQEGESA